MIEYKDYWFHIKGFFNFEHNVLRKFKNEIDL